MYAAVVHAFGQPPVYEEFPTPTATMADEAVVDVLAAALHPRTRSGANGTHYTSGDELPLVPGFDGVGRLLDGRLIYFILPDAVIGSMAQKTVVDLRRSIPLPSDVDVVKVAAAMNPAMSSWIALRARATLEPGQRVLVLGATGNAGRMAVQIAKRLGAGHVIGAGRDAQRLAGLYQLGADEVVSLDGDPQAAYTALGRAAAEVDVVLDYLWGQPAERAIYALVTNRRDESNPWMWIQIGSIAGRTVALPSEALRSSNLHIVGSGQGSVSARRILTELTALTGEITADTLTVDPLPIPLSDVERAWNAPVPTGKRIVFVPSR